MSLPETQMTALWPTPNAMDHIKKRTTHARGNLTLQGAVGGLNPTDAERHSLMSFAAASPARTSALPERARASTARAADYGPRCAESLARYDHASSSWRTSQLCLDGDLAEFSETFPRSGMMRSGIAYRLPPLVPLIGGTASGLWPTPDASVAQDGEKPETWLARRERVKLTANNGNGMGMPLTIAAQLWPTPSARDWKSGHASPATLRKNSRPLNEIVRLWPTPHGFSQDGKSNGPSGNELGWAVNRSLLPTPTANRRDGLQSHGVNVVSGSLNPMWVEWLQGFPLGWTELD